MSVIDESTGISICQTSDSRTSEQHIDVIHNWPACHTKISTKEKVPSEVAYLIEGLSWGALIRPEVSRYMWTKLELDRKPDGEAARISREVVQAANGHKDPVDIIADFLMEVRKHTIVNRPEIWQATMADLTNHPRHHCPSGMVRCSQGSYDASFR